MSSIDELKDPIGHAAVDYLKTSVSKDIEVASDIADEDVIPSSYLFRSFNEMPPLECKALAECRGKILDVGAAAGCHSLELQQLGKDITSLEISRICCRVMKQRGLKNILQQNFFSLNEGVYDTLLLLMNGIGIAGSLNGLGDFFNKSNKLLNKGGRIIFDSSDIRYLYTEDDGSEWVNLNAPYYGELKYKMRFQNVVGDEFPWLFVDFDTLADKAVQHGFKAELFARGDHYDYLGILTKV